MSEYAVAMRKHWALHALSLGWRGWPGAIGLAVGVGLLLLSPRWSGTWWVWPTVLGVLAIVTLLNRVSRRRADARERRLRAMNLCACLTCEHDLRGLGAVGRCPECGHEFRMPLVREAWQRRLDELEEQRQEPPGGSDPS